MGCIIKRLITITTPVRYQAINIFDENEADVTAACLFSWSSDGVCWTNFVSLDQYNTLAPRIENDYYLRILIVTGFSGLALDNKMVDCYTICIYPENPYLADLCLNKSIDFYAGLDCALLMYQQLSDLVCCMIGIPCYYFRVLPDKDTADYTFKEYLLHNVVDMKYLKLVCQDGSMPSSKPQMTEFDFDWETDWEVEMSKTAFAKAFGDTAFPKQRDIIYIPMMKRMWEVNAAYDEKQEGFMWRPVTWKLGLIKWNDKTNVNQGDFQDIIDSWAVNRVEHFLELESEEQEDVSGVTQLDAPQYVANNLYVTALEDAVRASVTITEMNNVKPLQLNHNAAVVTRDIYRFMDKDSVVRYVNPFCGESGTLLFIMDLSNPANLDDCFLGDDTYTKSLLRVGELHVDLTIDRIRTPKDTTYTYKVTFNGLSQTLDPTGTGVFLVQCRWNRGNFTSELNIIPWIQTVPPNTPIYQVRPEMHIFDFQHPLCTLTAPYNNDLIMDTPMDVILSPAPVGISNVKLFDVALPDNDMARESIKYTTKEEHCVINDLARPLVEQTGFSVR